jgi:DNA invertase Pin-like site-specific DNA recombinase
MRGRRTARCRCRIFRNDTCVASAAKHVSTAKRMKEDGHTAKDIAKYLGVSRATFYRDLGDVAA